MTVMQILTGENWNSIMFQVMTDVHPAAALYFLVVNCFGVYVPRGFESRCRDAHVVVRRPIVVFECNRTLITGNGLLMAFKPS
jgi:hypothetical protein